MSVRTLLLLGFACALAALSIGAPTAAGRGATPQSGTSAFVTPFEARIGAVLSELTGRPLGATCLSAEEWAGVGAALAFDPLEVYGFVLGPVGTGTSLGPRTCGPAEQFAASPTRRPQKECRERVASERATEYHVRRARVRVKVDGHWRYAWRNRRVAVSVSREVPVYATCEDWFDKLFALATMVHEASHLMEIWDEAQAECLGMQNLAWFAQKLGASAEFAREIANDYWCVYREGRLGTEYGSYECRDGGLLDTRPETPLWP